jgi:hypothetical protein
VCPFGLRKSSSYQFVRTETEKPADSEEKTLGTITYRRYRQGLFEKEGGGLRKWMWEEGKQRVGRASRARGGRRGMWATGGGREGK